MFARFLNRKPNSFRPHLPVTLACSRVLCLNPQPLRTPTRTSAHREGLGLGYITPLLHSVPTNEIQG